MVSSTALRPPPRSRGDPGRPRRGRAALARAEALGGAALPYALQAAIARQGMDIVSVERHGTRGKDTRVFILARKPA